MTYTALESHAYDNVLVIKYFCTTTYFSLTYVRTYSNLSNPAITMELTKIIPTLKTSLYQLN